MQNAFWQSGSDSRWFLNNQTKQLSRPWKLPSSEQTLVKTAVELAGNPATVRSTGFFFSMKSCSLSTLATTIILALFLAWLLLVCITTSTSNTGSYKSLTHLPDSQGEICGEGAANAGRGNLLYFEVSRCAGLVPSGSEICRSKQVRTQHESKFLIVQISYSMCFVPYYNSFHSFNFADMRH